MLCVHESLELLIVIMHSGDDVDDDDDYDYDDSDYDDSDYDDSDYDDSDYLLSEMKNHQFFQA